MKALSEICVYVAFFCKLFLLTLALAGCSASPLSVGGRTASQNLAGAIVPVIDSINDHFQPALPDDLKDESGSLPPDTAVAPEPKADTRRAIHYFLSPDPCEPCDKMVAEIKADKEYRWIKETENPSWVDAYPAQQWQIHGKWTWKGTHKGWPGMKEFKRIVRESLAKQEAAGGQIPSAPNTAVAPAASISPIYWSPKRWGNHVRWHADLRLHLFLDHHVNTESMSAEQAVAYHDALHGRHAADAAPRRRPMRGLSFSLACPFGGGR